MNIKKLRVLKGKTQQEVAKAINITQFTLSNYENEITEPNIETLKKIANYFDVSLDYLCENELAESKKENIKLFSDLKNKCYNLLVSMTEEQAKLTYSYMLGVTGQEFNYFTED